MGFVETMRYTVMHIKKWCLQKLATKKQLENLEITGSGDVYIDETEHAEMLDEVMPLGGMVTATINAYILNADEALYVSTTKPTDYTRAEAELIMAYNGNSMMGEYSLVTRRIAVPKNGSLYLWNPQASRLIVKDINNNTLFNSDQTPPMNGDYQHDGITEDTTFNVTLEV